MYNNLCSHVLIQTNLDTHLLRELRHNSPTNQYQAVAGDQCYKRTHRLT